MELFEKESRKSYKRWIIPLVDDALQKSNLRNGNILDVGCGPGLLSKEFAERSKNFQVTGIDLSVHAIKLSKENCKSLKNVSFRVADVSKISFDDEMFDLVICKDSMHHFDNLAKAIREMYRVLKPKGILYLQDLKRDVPDYLLKMVISRETDFQSMVYYSARAAYTKEEITKVLDDLSLRHSKAVSRKITGELAKNYKKIGIEINQLKAAFQSRYVITVKK